MVTTGVFLLWVSLATICGVVFGYWLGVNAGREDGARVADEKSSRLLNAAYAHIGRLTREHDSLLSAFGSAVSYMQTARKSIAEKEQSTMALLVAAKGRSADIANAYYADQGKRRTD